MEQAVKAESHQCKQVGESYYEARILQLETPADEFASLLNRNKYRCDTNETHNNPSRIDQARSPMTLSITSRKAERF